MLEGTCQINQSLDAISGRSGAGPPPGQVKSAFGEGESMCLSPNLRKGSD